MRVNEKISLVFIEMETKIQREQLGKAIDLRNPSAGYRSIMGKAKRGEDISGNKRERKMRTTNIT